MPGGTAKTTPHSDKPAPGERSHPPCRESEEGEQGRAIHLANGKIFFAIVPSDQRAIISLIRSRPDLFFCSNWAPEEYGNHVATKAPHPSFVREFCEYIRNLRDNPRVAPRPLVFYQTSDHSIDVAAAAVLMGAYLVVEEGLLPEVAAARLERSEILAHIPFQVLLSRLEDVGKRVVRGLFPIAEDTEAVPHPAAGGAIMQ